MRAVGRAGVELMSQRLEEGSPANPAPPVKANDAECPHSVDANWTAGSLSQSRRAQRAAVPPHLHGPHAFLDGRGGVLAVQIVKVHVIQAEVPQAALDGLPARAEPWGTPGVGVTTALGPGRRGSCTAGKAAGGMPPDLLIGIPIQGSADGRAAVAAVEQICRRRVPRLPAVRTGAIDLVLAISGHVDACNSVCMCV